VWKIDKNNNGRKNLKIFKEESYDGKKYTERNILFFEKIIFIRKQ